MDNNDQNRVSWFPHNITKEIALPDRFTFPFCYEPHPLTKAAAAALQHYLEAQTDHQSTTGKMFGVLVIQDKTGKVGYLSAFSGKLAGSNDHPKFVPPVFDMLAENSFFVKGIISIDAISADIRKLRSGENYTRLKSDLERISDQSAAEISLLKQTLKTNKEARKKSREEQKNRLSVQEYALWEADLVRLSLHDKYRLKQLTDQWAQRIEDTKAALASFDSDIEMRKNERSKKSAALQEQLFEKYAFLNKAGKSKSLQNIFRETASGKAPAAAGECATPKLLQYAFLNDYKPLAMAEFWWGASPKSEIRKHKEFYPACTPKCKPILAHMLEGIEVDEDPRLQISQEAVTENSL